MTLDWEKAKHVFGDAVALDRTDQEEYVRARCADDQALCDELMGLLSSYRSAGSFLQQPTALPAPKSDTQPDGADAYSGTVLASRYLLRAKLGSGGGGTVYEAEDLLRGNPVAVKILRGIGWLSLAGVRREVAMLRFLRLPGVVQLIDDGIEDDCGFIVMEQVSGAPFPGREAPCDWDSLADTVMALLDTLAKIHWAGVIHCDLKPGNVLVNEQGVPTVLDLGISAWQEADPRSSEEGNLFGTLRYMAPERLRGAPPTVAGDLFSLGVMAYAALAGVLPFEYQRDASMVLPFDAAPASAPPLRSLTANVSELVARVIDGMIAVDPTDRPHSAAAAHAALQGSSTARERPRFTDQSILDAVLESLDAGRPIDVAGSAGSGRTRLVRDVEAALTRKGRQILSLQPSEMPLGSLAPVLAADMPPAAHLHEIRALAGQQVREALERGVIIIADDSERLDRDTTRILEDNREYGAVFRTVPPRSPHALELTPATPHELEAMFAGTNRIHHLREDAAAELWRRTFGVPAAVAAELASWSRAGVARWENDRVVIARTELERLRAGLHTVPHRSAAPREDLPEHQSDLLACIDLAGDSATIEAAVRATDRARWQIEADLEDLEGRGLVAMVGDRPVLLSPTSAGQDWSAEKRRRAHRAIAEVSPPGSDARIYHLMAGEQIDVVIREVPDAALDRLKAGQAERALTLLNDGIAAVRRTRTVGTEERFLKAMLRAALALGTSTAVDSVLYHLARCEEEFELRPALEAIARAALSTLQGDADRARRMLETTGPVPDIEMQRSAWAVQVVAGSYSPIEQHEAVVEAAGEWADGSEDPDDQAAACGWLGWLRYRQHRFENAAELHAHAAEVAEGTAMRIAGFLDAAWASLEAGRFDDVEKLARQARALAAPVRHAHFEARAELMLRSAAYRRGDPLQPDQRLVKATSTLGYAHIHGLVALNEAAVAWRADRNDVACKLAIDAGRALRNAGVPIGGVLADSLGFLCGTEFEADDIESSAKAAASSPLPAAAVQILALLQKAAGLSRSWRERGREIAQAVPRASHAVRREVLSIEEALDWLLLH